MKNAKNKQIGFQLINIATEQFTIIPDAFDKSIKEISFSVNIDFGINKEENVIASVVKIQFDYPLYLT